MNHLPDAGVELADGNGTDGWRTVAHYSSHDDALQAVNHLAAMNFPIESTEIVGRDLRFVEPVTDPMNALTGEYAGGAFGAWCGLLIGVLIGLFTAGPVSPGLIFGGAAIGAICGAIIGRITLAVQHKSTGEHGLAAGRYELAVDKAHAEQARVILARTR